MLFVPIGHDRRISGPPYVTYAIMVICFLVQAYQSLVAPSDDVWARTLVDRFGHDTDHAPGLNAILSAFVHDGWLHLIGNMLFLWLAGSAIEDRWGRLRFVLLYLAGAVAATLAFHATYDGPGTVLIGASGAIAAAMGAFMVLFPGAEIRFWYFWFFRTGTFQLNAVFALALWFASQLVWASLDSEGDITGVAYASHIGGFVFGAMVALIARRFAPGDGDGEAIAKPRSTTPPPYGKKAVQWPTPQSPRRPGGPTQPPGGRPGPTRPPGGGTSL